MSLESLEFELPRRLILFHRDTEMPDQSLLGFTGDPNNAVEGDTPGETLLHYAPSGTHYIDKGVIPNQYWIKISAPPGGLWFNIMSSTGSVSGSSWLVSLQGFSKVWKGRYLFQGKVPTNIVGYPAVETCSITNYVLKLGGICTGAIDILIDGSIKHTINVNATDTIVKSGISIPVPVGAEIGAFVHHSSGLNSPTLVLELNKP